MERLEAFRRTARPHAAGTGVQLAGGTAVVSSIIAGATRPEQVEANVRAAGWVLRAEELAEIDRT